MGGEQIRRPEHERMTDSREIRTRTEVAVRNVARLPSRSRGGEGRCPPGRNGYVHQGRRRGLGPSMRRKIRGDNAGKGHLPAGTGDNLQRLAGVGITEAGERDLVWRMSSYER